MSVLSSNQDPVRSLPVSAGENSLDSYIAVENLVKRYDGKAAVSNISFSVRRGEIFGLLGPNGAGKTTTINVLSTFLRPTDGSIKIGGFKIGKYSYDRSLFGVVPQEVAVYEELTAGENLRFFGRLQGLSESRLSKRTEWVLDVVGLQEKRDQLVKNFSGGMKRRLNFAIGIVTRPPCLLLDEPLLSIDPQSSAHLQQVIKDLKQTGTAIVFATHQLDEAAALCDRVAIIDGGVIVAEGDISSLLKKAGLPPFSADKQGSLMKAFLAITGTNLRD